MDLQLAAPAAAPDPSTVSPARQCRSNVVDPADWGLGKPSRRLVATDEDFGKAYLREAWATKFLEPMFSEFAVLFVGYSHNDLIMSYLARGLRSNTRRWILTETPENPLYKRLRIKPIGFRVANGSYADAEHGLARWGDNAKMGLLDHHARLAEMLQRSPPDVPEEISYLEATLADPARTRLFTNLARGEEWLGWVAGQPQMLSIFDERAAIADSGLELASWFTQHFVADESLGSVALTVALGKPNRIHEALWRALARSVFQAAAPRGRWLTPWILLVLRDAPNAPMFGILEGILQQSEFPADRSVILALIEHLLRPVPILERNWFTEEAKIEVAFPCDDDLLDRAMQTAVTPHLADLAVDLVAIADSHLRLAGHLLVAGCIAAGQFALEPASGPPIRYRGSRPG